MSISQTQSVPPPSITPELLDVAPTHSDSIKTIIVDSQNDRDRTTRVYISKPPTHHCPIVCRLPPSTSLFCHSLTTAVNVRPNPGPLASAAVMQGSDLQNRGLQAEKDGDFEEAEQLYLQAIQIREQGLGSDSVTTALTRNALGELYLKMGRLDDAETNLNLALGVRSTSGPPFDAAVTRETLGQL
ncbi:hypothetical protein HGRIS_007930 [Hohenbuehelia grisea]|uniref:Tetratricopeptide repeat protein n=1 Tax=Hohenbuehelia grisea TaxID=104357 RepID=A0ABR3J6D8_9AGAR